MSELLQSPPRTPRRIKVEVPSGVREGWDLNDVVRDVVSAIIRTNGWSLAEAAKRLGVPSATLQGFLASTDSGSDSGKNKKDSGMSVASLSKIVAAYGNDNPIAFLLQHPVLRSGRGGHRDPELEADERAYDALCHALNGSQARKLSMICETLSNRGVLDAFLDVTLQSIGVRTE